MVWKPPEELAQDAKLMQVRLLAAGQQRQVSAPARRHYRFPAASLDIALAAKMWNCIFCTDDLGLWLAPGNLLEATLL
jgi:hypothetical protein